MPWISLKRYTGLVRENEIAQSLAGEVERLRSELERERERHREALARWEARLEREIARNQKREERLLDRVLTSKGAYAVTPAVERKAKAPSVHQPLSALEEAQLRMYVEDAAANGYGPDVARRMFERDRRRRLEPDADLSAYNDLPVIEPPGEIVDDFGNAAEAG